MKTFRTLMAGGPAAALALMVAPAAAAPVFVTNGADAGPGSFRAAVDAANLHPSIDVIRFTRDLGTVQLASTVVYTGAQSLRIEGRDTAIAGDGLFDLLVATGGGDLTLRQIGFSDGLNGIVVEVPADADGELSTVLFDVTVENNGEFGLLIDDETNGGSNAGIGLDIAWSRFVGNGADLVAGVIEDLDGVRVNERGEGDIAATIHASEFTGNGADGYELDEGGPGDVTLMIRRSRFDGNGLFEPEGDDGIDIDEADGGSIWLRVVGATFNGNSDDGIGIDESGEGDLMMSLIRVQMSDVGDKGLSADEGDAGDLDLKALLVAADGNVEDGLNFEEAGDGDLFARVVRSAFRDNGQAGIDATQGDAGQGTLRLQNVMFDNNGDGPVDPDGVEVVGGP
ncbi:MAG TPA: hypothetical protein VFZ01_01195 [Geminicoccaceae bacterium]